MPHRPLIYDYSNFADFLKDAFEFKVKNGRNFNATSWARKLGLSNLSTLTRILNGDRIPGPKIVASLCDNLEMSEHEKTYFTALVRLAKETDPALRALLENNIRELRSAASREKPLHEVSGTNLILWGTADDQAYNKVLETFGFESIQTFAGYNAPIFLSAAYFPESDLGPYSQFCLASYIRQKNEPLRDSMMFFDKVYSSEPAIVTQYNLWGSPFELKAVEHNLADLDCRHKHASLSENSSRAVLLEMNDSLIPVRHASQPNDVFGYNRKWGSTRRFPMKLRSTAQFRPFDPVTDRCEWSGGSEIGKLLTLVDFTPRHWSLHADFKAKISALEDAF